MNWTHGDICIDKENNTIQITTESIDLVLNDLEKNPPAIEQDVLKWNTAELTFSGPQMPSASLHVNLPDSQYQLSTHTYCMPSLVQYFEEPSSESTSILEGRKEHHYIYDPTSTHFTDYRSQTLDDLKLHHLSNTLINTALKSRTVQKEYLQMQAYKIMRTSKNKANFPQRVLAKYCGWFLDACNAIRH